MRHAPLDRVLSRGQRLAKHLAAEHLRAANIAACAAKNVFLNALDI